MWLRLFLWRTLFRSTEIELTEVVVLIPEFRSKPRPQLPNRHRLAVDADPKPGIRSGASSYLAHQNDMTGMPQFINPYRDTWAGGPQRIVVCVHHRQARVLSANNWRAQCGIRHPVPIFLVHRFYETAGYEYYPQESGLPRARRSPSRHYALKSLPIRSGDEPARLGSRRGAKAAL